MHCGPPQYDPEHLRSTVRPRNSEGISIFLGRLRGCLSDCVVLRVQYESRYGQSVNAGCQREMSRWLSRVRPGERVESPGNPEESREWQFVPSVWSPKPRLQRLGPMRCNSVKNDLRFFLKLCTLGIQGLGDCRN